MKKNRAFLLLGQYSCFLSFAGTMLWVLAHGSVGSPDFKEVRGPEGWPQLSEQAAVWLGRGLAAELIAGLAVHTSGNLLRPPYLRQFPVWVLLPASGSWVLDSDTPHCKLTAHVLWNSPVMQPHFFTG